MNVICINTWMLWIPCLMSLPSFTAIIIAENGACSPDLPAHQVASMCINGAWGPNTLLFLDASLAADAPDIPNVPLCACRVYVTNDTDISLEVGGNFSCGNLLLLRIGSTGKTMTSPRDCRKVSQHVLTVTERDYLEVSLIKFLQIPGYSNSTDYCASFTTDSRSSAQVKIFCGRRVNTITRDTAFAPSSARLTTEKISVEEESSLKIHPVWLFIVIALTLILIAIGGFCYAKVRERDDDHVTLEIEE